ncbi:MAG: aminotransferase class I/II-fold pyridoxal phosphate-dependent enzyme [Ruminococcaceae bacterium]|nr:aminotransferase class I/II-fold pyridoxal phosphate-dependent enzyme [Oscillospiraceae bacterium]
MIDYNKLLSKKIQQVKPSGIRRFFDIAEELSDCVSLGVGEPDFVTPWHIRRAGIRSLEEGHTHYTSNWGLMSLREAISEYLKRRFDMTYCAKNEIVVTVGGSEAIDMCIRAVVDNGDEVLIPEPSFVCYSPITSLSGGVPVALPTYEKDNFKLTAETLKKAITEKTKLLVLPFPNNPTGAVMEKEDLEKIAEVIRDKDILVLSDEIYAELTYKGKHTSISCIEGMWEKTIVVSGFSKAFAMTGWRLGYACGPREIIEQMTKAHQYAIMSAPTTAQYAAIEAMRNSDDDIEYMKNEYDMRRRYLVNALRQIGMDCFEPLGAFYVFPSIKKFGLSSEEFCERLIRQERCAVIPGNAFGELGEGFVRLSYAYSLENLKKAVERIEKFIKTL